MSHDWIADLNFFAALDAQDAETTAVVRAAGCPRCGGRLDRADYPRKPRGGAIGVAGELFERRRSLCCAQEGCRHRQTPTSLVFLGRRVYLGITVVVAAWRAAVATAPRSASPPRRTVRRWLAWFATEAARTPCVTELRGRMSPRMEPSERLPGALITRLRVGRTIGATLEATLRLLAPLSTTTSR